MKFARFFNLLVLASVFLLPTSTQAASLYIDPGISELSRGDAITMSVRLDTDEAAGECVNAVDAVITYTSNIEPVDISIGDSIFSMWVQQPTINRENHTISFAGGIPNGYCGRIQGDPRLTNVLTKIVFRSPGFSIGGSKELEAVVAYGPESTAYLNDGRGTKAELSTYAAKIQLSEKPGSAMINPWKDEVSADNIPPEEFSMSLQKDETAFSQKYYIVFNTTDKQTGIDHYEVMEESLAQFGTFQWGRADAPWLVTRSPYVLKDQSLNSIIHVKAIDKAGNEYLTSLIPDESMQTISRNQLLVSVLVIVLIILLIVLMAVWWIYRKNKRLAEEEENEEDDDDDDDDDDDEDEEDEDEEDEDEEEK